MGQTGPEIQFHYEERTTNVLVEWEQLNLWSGGDIRLRQLCGLGLCFQEVKKDLQKGCHWALLSPSFWAGSKCSVTSHRTSC